MNSGIVFFVICGRHFSAKNTLHRCAVRELRWSGVPWIIIQAFFHTRIILNKVFFIFILEGGSSDTKAICGTKAMPERLYAGIMILI